MLVGETLDLIDTLGHQQQSNTLQQRYYTVQACSTAQRCEQQL